MRLTADVKASESYGSNPDPVGPMECTVICHKLAGAATTYYIQFALVLGPYKLDFVNYVSAYI